MLAELYDHAGRGHAAVGVWYRTRYHGRKPRHTGAGQQRLVCAFGDKDRSKRCSRAFIIPPSLSQ